MGMGSIIVINHNKPQTIKYCCRDNIIHTKELGPGESYHITSRYGNGPHNIWFTDAQGKEMEGFITTHRAMQRWYSQKWENCAYRFGPSNPSDEHPWNSRVYHGFGDIADRDTHQHGTFVEYYLANDGVPPRPNWSDSPAALMRGAEMKNEDGKSLLYNADDIRIKRFAELFGLKVGKCPDSPYYPCWT